jgi:hypothetical protein
MWPGAATTGQLQQDAGTSAASIAQQQKEKLHTEDAGKKAGRA